MAILVEAQKDDRSLCCDCEHRIGQLLQMARRITPSCCGLISPDMIKEEYLEPATSGLSSVAPPAWRGAPGRRASEFRGRTGSEGAAVGASGVSYWDGKGWRFFSLSTCIWPLGP